MEEMYEDLSDLGVPLICAGGIGSEKELIAAMKMGYDGVQMGTRFIATDECTTPQDYKDAIVNAKEEDITWTTKLTGVPIAVIETKGSKKHSNWLIRRLLKSRFKHQEGGWLSTACKPEHDILCRYLSLPFSINALNPIGLLVIVLI